MTHCIDDMRLFVASQLRAQLFWLLRCELKALWVLFSEVFHPSFVSAGVSSGDMLDTGQSVNNYLLVLRQGEFC